MSGSYVQLLLDCLTYGSSYMPFWTVCGLPAWASLLPFGGEQLLVGPRRFRVLHKLGEGGYAVVLLVLEQPTAERPSPDPEPRALKKILVPSDDLLESVQQEMLIHSAVQHHPNILPLLDFQCSDSGGGGGGGGGGGARRTTGHPSGVPSLPAADGGGDALPSAAGAAAAIGGAAAHSSITVAPPLPGGGGGGGGGEASSSSCNRVACFLFPVFPDGTLAAEVDRLAGRGEMLPTAEVLYIVLQMARAACHMHACGYAHRDIKPLNVLISTDPAHGQQQRQQQQQQLRQHKQQVPRQWQQQQQPHQQRLLPGQGQGVEEDVEAGEASSSAAGPRYRCVVMDFGSARPRMAQTETRLQALQLQEDAEAHCSAPYRAPELLDPPSPATLDYAASDVWALGASLFQVMYGEPPFQRACSGAGGSLALAVLNGAIGWPRPPAPAYPQELHSLVSAAMAPEPADRPSAEQLVAMVEQLIQRRLPDPPPRPPPAAMAAHR